MDAFSDEAEQSIDEHMTKFKGHYQTENICSRNQSSGGSSGGFFAGVTQGI